jgi:hypothetical protein
MDIVIKPSGGANIVVRPQALPRWSPAATVDPVQVEVWWREIADDGRVGAWVKLDSFAPGAKGSMPYNPALDRNVEFSLISVSAAGVKSVMHPDDGVRATMLMQRETDAPVIGQVGDATVDTVSIGIAGFTQYARKQRVKIAESLSGGVMVSPTVIEFDGGVNPVPTLVDILRTGTFAPSFSWRGNDPVSHGFTKTGSAPVESNSPGWKINSTGLDTSTFYSKSSWPATPFAGGFTLDLLPPLVLGSDVAGTSLNAGVTVDDGSHRFVLQFSSDKVSLNGGTEHTHSNLRVRLVVAAGGATADLWIGEALTEDNTAAAATVAAALKFGDLSTTDDASVTWFDLSYALTPVPVTLAQTVYVSVAHSSGGAYGAESEILQVSFAADSVITNSVASSGSSGDFDSLPRNKIDYDTGGPLP